MTGEKMGDLLPERGTECPECEILTIGKCNLPNYHRSGCNCGGLVVKCMFHGGHKGHRLRLSAYSEEDGTWSNRYYCDDCRNWAWKRGVTDDTCCEPRDPNDSENAECCLP